MEDNKKWLYNALSKKGYDLGNYKDYEVHSSEPESQKWLYDSSVKAGLDVGSFDEFQSGMNFNKTNGETGKMPDLFNIGGKELSREQLLAPANGQVTAITDAVQPVKEVPKPIPVSEKKVTPASVYNEMEDQVLDKKLASAKEQPYYLNSYDDIRDHYFSRFSMTDEGKRSQTELVETQKDLVDMLSAKLKESQAYKDIMSSSAAPADKDTAIQALWETEYLPELDKQMEPFVNEYSQKVLSRYGKRMSDDTALLDKTTARNSWESIESRINEYENELEKRKGGWKDVSSPTYESNLARVQREVSSKDYNEKSRQVSAARSMMERSRKMIEAADAESEGTFVEGLARGFKDEAFNLDNWTMGLKGLADGQACLNVLEKCEKEGPESLNKEEKLLMDAIVSNAATQAYFQSELGRGYKAGSVTGASLPFMVDMMTGTAAVSASTKAATKGLMKWIAKNYSKNTIKKNITKGVTGLSKGVMDASIHTASFGMGRVADDYTQRGIGNVTFDSDGQSFQYAGRKGAESGLGAAGKAFASTALETQSELIGNQFAPSLKFVGRQIMRLPGLKNIPASKFGEYMKSVYGSASAKGVREFAKRAQFQGPIAEYAEEVYNNLGSVAIGDMTPEQLVDLDQNIDTFLGVGVMSAAFGLVGTGAFIRERYKTGKEIRSFEEKMKEHIDFDRLKADIKSQDIEGARTFVKQVMNDPSLSAEERKEEIKYIANVLKETAMNSAEAEMGKESLPQEDIEENKSAIFTEFETARKNMESALSPEIVGRIDAGEDIQNILSSEGLSEQQQDAIVDYHAAKVDFEDYISSVRNKVADARETARKEVEGVSNPDMGAVVRVNSNLSPDPVHIVGGTLAFDEEGFVDEKNSSDVLYYLDENGVRKMASPSAFVSLVDMNDTDSVAQQAEDDAEKQTIAEEQAQLPQPYAPMVGDEVVIQEGIKGTVTGFTPEGDALVSDGNRVYVAPLNGIMPQNDAENEIPPQAEESKVSEETMQPKNSPVNPDVQKVPVEAAPADTANAEEEQPSSPTIPMDDKGNMLYHKAKIEDTLADLNDGSLEDNEIDDFISANRKEAMANLEKLEKKPPKMGTNKTKYLKEKADHKAKMDEEQQRINYWDNVAKELKAMREKPGDAVADEILSMEEPMNGEEFAAQQLANGNLPLLQSSFSEETGFGRDEAKKYFGLFSSQEKGGMSIQEAGEALMQADRENGTNFFDQNDPNAGRDAIINVLAQATTKKELADIIKNNREAAAEKERVAEYEAYEQWCDEYFHMTPEDYESYQETWTSVVEEKYKDFDEQEFYGNIADELKQIENDTQGEITGTIESDAVLQGEEPVSSGRTGSSEGQQGSAIQAGLPGSDTNGTLSEGASGEETGIDKLRNNDRRGTGRSIDEWKGDLAETQITNATLLKEEKDENGHSFVKSPNGSIDFGFIESETGLGEAPIRLVGETEQYGKKHIERNHGEQIKNAGFNSVEDFVSYVASNYDSIKVGNKYFDKITYLIELTDKKNNTLFVELSSDGTYWNVNSAGVFRKNYSKKKEVIWTAPAVGHNSATENKEVASSITGNESSTGSTSGDSSQVTSLLDKDSKLSDKKQETTEELLQNKDNSLTLPHKDKNEAVSESVSQSRIINQENDERRKVESLSGEGSSVNGTDEADTILRRAGDRTTTPLGQSSWTKDALLRDVLQRGKETKTWIEDLQSIAKKEKIGAGGENDVYLSNDGHSVIKVNNFSYLPNNSSNFDSFMNRVDAHNELFPNDAITVLGFAYNSKGEVSVVLSQPYIKNTREATQEEIDDFFENMGFYTDMSGNWTDGTFDIADTKPNNVLVDENGLLHFIDVLPYDSRKPGKMLVIPEQNQKKFEPSSIKPNENILDYAERVSREWNMHKARQSVNTNPTEAQKEAGNYKKGHIKLDGYDITIENPKGSVRSGRDANGQEWSITMNNDYGYIRGTKAVDGDHIDIFLSDNPSEGNVFVVDQLNEKGEFDESKVMYGFPSMDEAHSSYLANYSPGWENRISTITEVTKDEFYKWIDSSVKKTKPFSEYKSVNPVQLAPSIESANADRMKDIETRLAEIEDRKIELEDILVEAGNDSVERDAVFSEQQELNQEQQELEAEYSGLLTSEGSDIRFREVGNEEISSFANKHNLDEADVKKYAQSMKMKNLGGASYAFKSISRNVRLQNSNLSLGQFVKVFSPIKKELYEKFGDVDALRDEYVQEEMKARNMMEAARKRAEEEAESEKKRLKEFELMTDEEMDEAYFKAMEENNKARMRDIINESARRNGYVSADEFRMAHRAPSYDEEGIDKNMVDIAANKDQIRESLNEQLRMNRDQYKNESAAAINETLSAIDKGEKPTVTIYRAIPKSLKEGKVRNGDWVSLSESYVKVHGEHALNGNYRIMKEEVPAENLYWDGNDINEWGYDDRSDYRYKNTKNNRKLNDLITRDDKGNVIPPSKRFNVRKADVRYRFIGEKGASQLDKAEEATTRLDNLNVAREMESAFNTKKGRIEKLRKSEPVEITGKEIEPSDDLKQYKKNALEYGKKLQGEYTNKDTGRTIQLQRGRKNGGLKEILQHDTLNDTVQIKSVAAIPSIIENAIYIDSSENQDVQKNPNVVAYHYYICGLKIGSEDYTVRMVEAEEKDGNRYYDHKLTHIEKGKLINELALINPSSSTELSSTPDAGTEDRNRPTNRGEIQTAPISNIKDKKLVSLLQTNEKENARKIKQTTGWERGADGKWRYEVEDFEIDPKGLARKNRLWSNLSWGKEYDALSDKLFDGVELTEEEAARFDELSEKAEGLRATYEANDVRYLDDYVKDENLFKTYPELKQIRVEIYNAPTSNTGATYYGSQNLIRVNESVLDRADFRSILAHEVQHAVQSIEGFARGGNSMTYRKHLDALKEKRDAWSMIEEFADKREELGEDASQMDVYNALVNEYHSDGFEFGDGFIPSRNAFDKGFNLWVRGYDKEGYEDAYNEYQSLIEKFGLGGENDRYNELSGEVEARNVQSRMNMTPEERRNTLASETEDVAREDQIFLNDALAESSAMMSDNLDNVNQRFNDRLDNLNERNADRVTLSLGMPSDVLLSAGVSEKPLKLYGNKIIKKMKKHGFKLEELHDLPKAVANPIAVFDNYRKGNGSRSVLTELNTRNGNFLVTLNVGKGEDIDFNIVSSVFGKGEDNVVDWIERELATYINKEKALNYLHHSALRAEALSSSRLSHATKIVESFENPTLEQGKISSSVNELSKSLHTPVKIIRNVNEITDADGKTEQRKRKSKGWFDTSTGEVVLVLPNASSVEDARETVFHEAVAHYGLRKMFGKDFDTFLDNVYANAEQSIRSKINARGGNKRVATEEYLAELAERGFEDKNERSLWQKVKDFLVDMLRKAGVKLGFRLSDNELRYILWKSYQNLSDNNVIDVARDIAKQYELKVGEYRFRDDVTDNIPDDGSREAYEQSLKKEWYKAREAYQDSMLSLKNLQEVVAKTSGSPIQTFENAYMAENQMSSKNTSESEKYYNEFFEPLEKEIARLMKNNSVTYDELSDYMMLKHGIERNIEFSVRDAIKEVEKDQGFDTAKQMKEDYEADKVYLLEDLKNGILSEETYIRELEALGLRYAGTINDYSATRTLLGKMTGKALPAGVKEKKRDDAYIQMFEDQYGKDADVMALANDKVREFEQKFDSATLWKRINAATKHPLKKAYESGLMSKEAYEHTNDMFRFYVPLRGWEEKKADDEYEYLSSDQSPVNSVLRSAKGRRSIPDNPIPVIGNMAESTIMQGNKNVMKQYFLNMAMNHPTDVVTIKKAWYVKDLNTGDWIVSYPDIQENDSAEEIDRKIAEHEERMNKLKDAGEATQSTNGLNINYRIGKSQVQEHIVTVKRNGKDYTLFINGNPRAAQAINGMTNPDVEKNPMMKAIGTANRWLSANFTTRNPAFVLSNLTRDLIFAQSAVLVKESPEYAGKFFQNVPKAMKAILANLNDKGDMSKEIDRYFKEFLENGGETGYMTLTDVDKYKKKIKKDLERMTGEEGKAKHALRWCVDRMEDFNRWAEDVSRFTTYMTSRQMGRSITESVNDAKEVTVNFNKKGAGLKTGGFFGISAGLFRGLYLFFNAGVQSLTNFGRLAKKNPVKFGTMLGGFTSAGFVVPALINSFLYALLGGTGDDDPYMDLPEWVRRNNLCLYTGNGKFMTIPLPIELRAFYGLGEMAYSYTVSKSKVRPTEVTYDMANQLTELLPLNPLGHNGDAVSTLMPDVLKPFWQINQNEDFTGKPIYKKTAFNELDPEFKRVYKGTSGWLVDSSRFLNEISGGSDFRKGVIDVNPAEVEHLFESYFGGMGKTLNQLGKTLWYGAKSVAEGERNENLKLKNVPALNRFITEVDERSAFAGVNKEYYKMVDEFEVIDHEVSGLTQKASLMNPKYLKEYADFTKTAKFQWYKKFEKLKSNIDRMYKASKSIPEGEARKAIDMQILDAKRKAISLMEENGKSATGNR